MVWLNFMNSPKITFFQIAVELYGIKGLRRSILAGKFSAEKAVGADTIS